MSSAHPTRRGSMSEEEEEKQSTVSSPHFSSSPLSKPDLARQGVFVPQSKTESEIASLRSQVLHLSAALEQERAARFRDVQARQSLQAEEAASVTLELASLSRKLHESRVEHQKALENCKKAAEDDVLEQVVKGRGKVYDIVVDQVVNQVERGQGKLYESVMNKLMGELQGELNSGEGELFERVMIPVKAQIEKNAVEKRTGKLYESVRQVVESELQEERRAMEEQVKQYQKREEDKLQERQREFESLQRKEEEKLIDREKALDEYRRKEEDKLKAREREFQEKQRIQEEALTQRARELEEKYTSELLQLGQKERELHLSFEERVDSMVSQLRQEHRNVQEHLQSVLTEQQVSFEKSYKQEVEAVSNEWQLKWSAREAEWMDRLKALEHEKAQANAKLSQTLEAKSNEAVKSLVRATEESVTKMLDKMDSHWVKLQEEEAKLTERVGNSLQTGLEKVSHAVESYKAMLEKGKDMELQAAEGQLDALRKLAQDEKERFTETVASMQKANEKERADLQQFVAAERERMTREKDHALTLVKEQYDRLTNALQDHHRSQAEKLAAQEADLIARTENLNRSIEQAKDESQVTSREEADKRWKLIMKENLATWKQQEKMRQDVLVRELETRHAAVIETMQQSIEASKNLKQDADKAWADRFVELQEESARREEQYKLVCKAMFEKRMDKFQQECFQKFEEMERLSLQQGATHAEVRCKLEREIHKVKSQAVQEKLQAIQQLDEAWGERLAQLEKAHSEELTSLSRTLAEAQEKARVFQEMSVKHVHHATCERLRDSRELYVREWDAKASELKRRAGEKVLQQHRAKILELWSSLRLHVSEYAPFLLHLFETVPFSPRVEALFEEQVGVLAAKLPLLKLAAERELLKQEVIVRNEKTQLERTTVQPCEQVERDVLIAKLAHTTQILEGKLALFLERFPREKLVYNGTDYRRLMQRERKQMPDLNFVPGTLKGRLDDVEFEL